MSKNVIIVLVTLGHFPPQWQAEGAACCRICTRRGRFWGSGGSQAPGQALGGREHMILSTLSSGPKVGEAALPEEGLMGGVAETGSSTARNDHPALRSQRANLAVRTHGSYKTSGFLEGAKRILSRQWLFSL